MTRKFTVFLALVFWSSPISGHSVTNKTTLFPEDFIFGVSTSAYQIEGGWNEDGKGWSVWDYLTHTDPSSVADGTNADVAADSYHQYKRDVEMILEMGIRNYKFSIAWPRILPIGVSSYVNPKGIAYYNALIDELLAKGIEPFVTIFHWDLPQHLEDKGGLLNNDLPTWFGEYARVLFKNFGDRVKYWMTINESTMHCLLNYEFTNGAPRIYLPGRGVYDCNRNLLLAHAKAYHIYDKEFRPTQHGMIGINVLGEWPIASTNSSDDAEAVLDYHAFNFGLAVDPIFSKTGNYPKRVIDRVAWLSAKQGLNSSRLRPLTEEEVNYIRGSADYLALNHYSSDMVYRNASLVGKFHSPSILEDRFVENYKNISWRIPNTPSRLWPYAPGFYNLLLYIKNTYDNPPTYVVENGFISESGLIDDVRVSCLRDYLSALQGALEAGANVKGFFFWSLMDNVEWMYGLTSKYGLYEVDFNSTDRKRTARKSALVYKEIIRSRFIDYDYNPNPLIGRNGASTITKCTLIGGMILVMLLNILNVQSIA